MRGDPSHRHMDLFSPLDLPRFDGFLGNPLFSDPDLFQIESTNDEFGAIELEPSTERSTIIESGNSILSLQEGRPLIYGRPTPPTSAQNEKFHSDLQQYQLPQADNCSVVELRKTIQNSPKLALATLSSTFAGNWSSMRKRNNFLHSNVEHVVLASATEAQGAGTKPIDIRPRFHVVCAEKDLGERTTLRDI